MTLAKFNETVEEMRKAYPFKDEETVLVRIMNKATYKRDLVKLRTVDQATGTFIELCHNTTDEREEVNGERWMDD